MKVLNIAYDDYANFSYDNCQALKSIGIYADSCKRLKHPFNYENESIVIDHTKIIELIKKYDIIQLMHSDHTYLEICAELGKKVVVYHTGTRYRQEPDKYNSIFNPMVERSFTDQCEFIGLGMKNETYIATAIDHEKFKPKHWLKTEPYTIGHYPSNPIVKGTDKIIELIGQLRAPNIFRLSTDKVSHIEQMRRMSQCDIYIEMFQPTLNGKQYGCYGVTAFEAASMEKIVITNNVKEEVYTNSYGSAPGLFIANTEESFLITLENILSQSTSFISELQQKSRQWIIEKHSYKATGERIAKLLGI